MKRILGMILIVLGVASFFLDGISFTTEEKVLDIGPIQMTADKKQELSWPSYTGAVLAVAGVVLILLHKKKA
jgi:drug/metabolite transporter (DMT)-like permease